MISHAILHVLLLTSTLSCLGAEVHALSRWIVAFDSYVVADQVRTNTFRSQLADLCPCVAMSDHDSPGNPPKFIDHLIVTTASNSHCAKVDESAVRECMRHSFFPMLRKSGHPPLRLRYVVLDRPMRAIAGDSQSSGTANESTTFRRSLLQRRPRPALMSDTYRQPASFMEGLDVVRLWQEFQCRGEGVNVATFDTGVATRHRNFEGASIARCVGYTDQGSTCEDGFGHGTFVAGVIAAQEGSDCPGMAPRARLHVFKVFTDQQVSYTSWFLDAFNHALQTRSADGNDDSAIDLINLSIGGMDYFDRPFVEKVNEVSSAGITVVTAIGNEGPLWGTCFNPGDQLDVLGVGAHTSNKNHIAPFSSRGMTTWEIPAGFGRPKPDVVTFGEHLRGTSHRGGCRELSGTSVASPVATGGLALVASLLKKKGLVPNPALLKQILMETAVPLRWEAGRDPRDYSIFAQGAGRISVERAMTIVATGGFVKHISFFPAKLDFRALYSDPDEAHRMDAYISSRLQGSSRSRKQRGRVNATAESERRERARVFHNMDPFCVYMWPYCSIPLYFSSMPLIVNLTVLNSFSSVAKFERFTVHFDQLAEEGLRDLVHVDVECAPLLWPWTGSAVLRFMVVKPLPAHLSSCDVHGSVTVRYQIMSDGSAEFLGDPKGVTIPFSLTVRQTPARAKRLLWDMRHQLQYPPGFIPRDNLDSHGDLLDWHGDSPFTNFASTYLYMTNVLGYSVEILSDGDFTTFNASHYGALLLIDTEDYFFTAEVEAIRKAVHQEGLSLVVFADWYHEGVMKSLGFTDDNTNEFWSPYTGGCNGRALNQLLQPFDIQLAASAFSGKLSLTKDSSQDDDDPNAFEGVGDEAHRGAASLKQPHRHRHSTIASGTSLYSIGKNGNSMFCVNKEPLRHAVQQRDRRAAGHLRGAAGSGAVHNVPVLALYQSPGMCVGDEHAGDGADVATKRIDIVDEVEDGTRVQHRAVAGRVAVFTDSDCLDSSSTRGAGRGGGAFCFTLLENLLHFAVTGEDLGLFAAASCTRGSSEHMPAPCERQGSVPRPASVMKVAAPGAEKIPVGPAANDPLATTSLVLLTGDRIDAGHTWLRSGGRPDRRFPPNGGSAFVRRQHSFSIMLPFADIDEDLRLDEGDADGRPGTTAYPSAGRTMSTPPSLSNLSYSFQASMGREREPRIPLHYLLAMWSGGLLVAALVLARRRRGRRAGRNAQVAGAVA